MNNILLETCINKFKEDNVVATIQPIFLNYDLHMAEGRIGKERVKTTYNWKSLFDSEQSYGADLF
jgi:predicted amidohydrolase YtcJ